LTRSQLYDSPLPVQCWPRCTHKFCRWLSLPIIFGIKGSLTFVHRSQEVLKTLSLYTYISFAINCFIKRHVQQSFLHFTGHQLLLDGFSNCVAILALDFDTPDSWARHFSDFLGVCSSLTPVSCDFSSVSTRRLRVPLFKFIHQILNCFSAGNSFITSRELVNSIKNDPV
jgi:hypothetical protein